MRRVDCLWNELVGWYKNAFSLTLKWRHGMSELEGTGFWTTVSFNLWGNRSPERLRGLWRVTQHRTRMGTEAPGIHSRSFYRVLAFLHNIAPGGGGVCASGPQLSGGGMSGGLWLPWILFLGASFQDELLLVSLWGTLGPSLGVLVKVVFGHWQADTFLSRK